MRILAPSAASALLLAGIVGGVPGIDPPGGR
jgi:hypothetical protein